MKSLAVLITSFNRPDVTNECLNSLFAQKGLDESFNLVVVLVDASTNSETADLVAHNHPRVELISAPSDTYWGSGMRLAAQAADKLCTSDGHLWLNDDVVLSSDGILRLLDEWERTGSDAIVVGQLTDAIGTASYGGYTSQGKRIKLKPNGVSRETVACSAFNGNVVLIPTSCIADLGYIDVRFPHTMGDVDYGLRAGGRAIPIRQPRGAVGRCDRHPPLHTFRHFALSRLRAAASIKEFPFRPWWEFCRRHAGWQAPLYFIKPYVSAAFGRAS